MCVSVLPLPLLFVATVTARRHHYHTFDVHCFSFHFGTLSTISAAAGDAAESEYKKKYENKTKTTNESGDSCLCENWLAHVHCHGANVIHDEMKLRCEIIQISFPFIQAPLFKCLILIKKIMNNARAYTKTQRIKLNQMNYCRMWAGERPVSTAGCVHAIDIW